MRVKLTAERGGGDVCRKIEVRDLDFRRSRCCMTTTTPRARLCLGLYYALFWEFAKRRISMILSGKTRPNEFRLYPAALRTTGEGDISRKWWLAGFFLGFCFFFAFVFHSSCLLVLVLNFLIFSLRIAGTVSKRVSDLSESNLSLDI